VRPGEIINKHRVAKILAVVSNLIPKGLMLFV